jgi:alanyl-tRNA synthetase
VATQGFGADKWVQQVAPLINGKGGGKDLAAQATGSNTQALKQALEVATEFAKLNI